MILIFAFLLRLIIGFSFPNILWADEIFQTLEQGHRLAFGNGIIPWEFREGIRSWLFPGFLGGWMKLTAWLGNGSIGYMRAVIFLLSLLSLIPVWIAFSIANKVNGLQAGIVAGSICAIWFELIYFSSKALTEVVATYPLLIAVYWGFYQRESLSNRRRALIGFLYGLTVILRLHYLPAVIVALFLQSLRDNLKNNLSLIFGFLSALLIGGVLDAFTWKYPFQSLWKNIKINLFDGVSHSFGTSPWYQYLSWMLLSWSLLIIGIIFLCTLVAKRHFVLVSIALTLVITHSLIAHKEYRFMASAIQIIIILSALGTAELISYLRGASHFFMSINA
ncbi:MAG: hypothetical protein ACK58N_08605 [Synechocystis sp.]